jgi:hypothetical protein
MSHGAETSGTLVACTLDLPLTLLFAATLHARYSGLAKVESEIKQRYKLDRVTDKRFQVLKSKWIFLQDYLTADPVPPEQDQADFVNDVLNGADEGPGPKPPGKESGGGIMGFVSSFKNAVTGGGSGQDTKSKSSEASKSLTDPAFVILLRPLEESFPVLDGITKQIYERLEENLLSFESRFLQTCVDKIISAERKHQIEAASQARGINSRHEKEQSYETLVSDLQAAMTTTVP